VSAERFRAVVSMILTVGVTASAVLIGAGFAAAQAVGWQGSLVGNHPAATMATTDFGGLAARLTALEPLAIAQLGLLALVATPIARVATSVVAFAWEGDRLYAAITLVVLIILLGSVLVLR
jgi:uncharacterized membrane protein